MIRKKIFQPVMVVMLSAGLLMTGLTGCGSSQTGANSKEVTTEDTADQNSDRKNQEADEPPEIDGLTYESTLELDYAKCFNVYYYEDGYKLLDVPESGEYLLVPEDAQEPDNLSDDITVIHTPLSNVYLAATSAMSLFNAIDSLDVITMTGTDASGWNIEAPKEALENGSMTYAGKYNAPDYELLVGNGCDLAIESTMILHSPEVQEMIEDLDIPVFIDRSSYESDALGRCEWIKLYGAMVDKEEEAKAYFDEQASVINELEDVENTGKTVAYFSINNDGSVVVRTSDDYIANMIQTGGGKYIFDDLENTESDASTMTISMEEFYSTAVDADYIVYNATIEESLTSVNDLIKKNDLFSEFKAVKEGNVWQVDKTLYQSTDKVGQLIRDFNLMLTDGDESQMTFLTKVAES